MEREDFIPPEALQPEETRQDNMPFKEAPEKVREKRDINAIIHSLKTDQLEPTQATETTTKFEHQTPDFAITEYFNQGRDLDWLKEQKNNYERMKEVFGDLLPETFFVVGEPSNPALATEGKSFYTIQDVRKDQALKQGKSIDQLNEKEYSVETMDRLLAIQEKIRGFIEGQNMDIENLTDINPDQLNMLDQKKFKDDILYDPKSREMRLTGLFDIDLATARQLMDNKSKFEPTKLKLLSMVGLTQLQ
jgi:hypothetical protein